MKWPDDIATARSLQEELRAKVRIIPLKKRPAYVAGVDSAFIGDKVIAVACLYTYPQLEPVEDADAVKESSFPYVPGYLTFREGPAIMSALKKLKRKPDLLVCDGQGIAHPRRIGIAAHLGVLLDMPSIGCAKTRLIGDYAEPGRKKGNWSYLKHNGEIIGAVLRTRSGVKPVFVSPGHKIDMTGSIEIVLNCTDKYRIPEPLRRADMLSKKIKRKWYPAPQVGG